MYYASKQFAADYQARILANETTAKFVPLDSEYSPAFSGYSLESIQATCTAEFERRLLGSSIRKPYTYFLPQSSPVQPATDSILGDVSTTLSPTSYSGMTGEPFAELGTAFTTFPFLGNMTVNNVFLTDMPATVGFYSTNSRVRVAAYLRHELMEVLAPYCTYDGNAIE